MRNTLLFVVLCFIAVVFCLIWATFIRENKYLDQNTDIVKTQFNYIVLTEKRYSIARNRFDRIEAFLDNKYGKEWIEFRDGYDDIFGTGKDRN